MHTDRTARMAATLLSGSWRAIPSAPSGTIEETDLPGLAELLVPSGTGALAWWALRETALSRSPAARGFHDAFRLHALEGAVHEERLALVLSLLRSAGIHPLLLKGWSVARLYPVPALRPYGDVDLLVRPEEVERARAALDRPEVERVDIDLAAANEDLDDVPSDALYRGAMDVPLRDGTVKLLSFEHQLRHLCVHQLRHGLWRPLWLCDVALLLESLPPGFDWERCLAGDRWISAGVLHVIGLARELLGARATTWPPGTHRLPGWLVPAVLAQWPRLTEHYYSGRPLGTELAHPGRFFGALRQRWRGPIQATVALRAPWQGWPRLSIQIADYLIRTVGFLKRRGAPLADD